VAHPFLDRAQWRPGGGHLRPERVAQFVERDDVQLGAFEGLREALAQLGGVEDAPGERMGEHQVLVAAPARALEMMLELLGEAVGHRHRAAAMGFGESNAPRVKLSATRTRAALQIDVDPAQTEELALAQARHGGGHVDGPFQRAEVVVRHGAQEGLELLGLQEADAAVR
jgi:hypothetical protein